MSAGLELIWSNEYTAILELTEYGLYKEFVGVLSKIIFYLLQDGGRDLESSKGSFNK